MNVSVEVNFSDLQDFCWGGALTTLNRVQMEHKHFELMDYLEQIFGDCVSLTKLNDFLWFDQDIVYDHLGISYINE